jgi:hypothetical protein
MPDQIGSVVDVEMQALEYLEAAWEADREGSPPPDIEGLPDPVVGALARYEDGDLPLEAQRTVQVEVDRRAGEMRIDRALAWLTILLVLAAGALIWIHL